MLRPRPRRSQPARDTRRSARPATPEDGRTGFGEERQFSDEARVKSQTRDAAILRGLSAIVSAALVIVLTACGSDRRDDARGGGTAPSSPPVAPSPQSNEGASASTAAAAAATAPECREEPMKSREACDPAAGTNPAPEAPR